MQVRAQAALTCRSRLSINNKLAFMKAIFWIAIAALATVTPSLFAKEQIGQWQIDTTRLQQIATQTPWLQLLAYTTENNKAANTSAITNPDFFLAPTGRHNPTQELLATLIAFSAPLDDADKHAQCRFPARYLWLSHELDFTALGIKPIDCPKYLHFSENNNAQSISVIFATGYLGNPASYYGHMLIKINSASDSKNTDLESTAINFGANVPPHENMLKYIVKGIFGGYDSSFTHQQYFYHAHNYGESELRDLWEYELDLDRADLNLLIAHVWELINADYTYYFFNRNCAYRIGELLQLVTKHDVVNLWHPWETPQAIMQKLGNLSYQDRALIKNIRYHPSRQSRLYERYKALSKPERKIIHSLVQQPEQIKKETLTTLDLEQQFKVVDTLIDYYQFVRKDQDGNKDINNERYRNALSTRYQLPPNANTPAFSSQSEPHLGRKPSYINVSAVSHETQGESVNLWLRPAYYDSLDGGSGHIKNAALSMGELTLAVAPDSAYVRNFNLVKIESIRRNYTGLPGDRNNSWYLEAGAEQEWLDCTQCLASKIRSGYGYATSISNDRLLIAGFAGAGFLGRSLNTEGLYTSGLATINLNINSDWALRAEAELRHYKTGDDIHIYRTQARWHFSTQMDTRLYFAQDREQEFGVSLGLYW